MTYKNKNIVHRFIFSSLLILLLSSNGFSQLKSIKIFGDYSFANQKRILVNKIDAVGGGVGIYLKIYDNFSIGIIGCYQLFSLQQDSALEKWRWDYYEYRWKGNIRADLLDSNYQASIRPVQKMDVIPIMLSINYSFDVLNNIVISPFVGGGVIFYTRRLMLEEYWTRKYPQADYTFSYNYQNFAPTKSGNPFFLIAGTGIEYQFSEIASLAFDFSYTSMMKTAGKYGFEEFPFSNSFNFKFGLSFLY